jgi:hypothetical protein
MDASTNTHNPALPTTKYKTFFTCFFIAFVFLMICSKSSFLYPFNDWPDINTFLTMGKGLLNGRVPYIDLIDQKGPWVFAIAAFAHIVAPSSFHGFFWLEVISFTVFLFYTIQIIRLYSDEKSAWALALVAAAITSSRSFVHGGSIEELFIGIFAFALYDMLLLLKQQKRRTPVLLSLNSFFLHGFLAGVILWSKFTLLGGYFAFMAVAVLACLSLKRFLFCLKAIGAFFSGILLATLPWFLYFGYHHAIRIWLSDYVVENIFSYSAHTEVPLSLWDRLVTVFQSTRGSLFVRGNIGYGSLVFLGMITFCLTSKKLASLAEKVAVCFMFFMMTLGIYIGITKHDYYGLPLSIFTIFGVLFLHRMLYKLVRYLWIKFPKLQEDAQSELPIIPPNKYEALCFFTFLFCILFTWRFSDNTYLIGTKKAEMPQFQFQNIINQSADRTLLNYGFLDGGFYTACGQVPIMKYYCRLNRNADEIMAHQNMYIQEALTDFVVTWHTEPVTKEVLMNAPPVTNTYRLVAYTYFYFEKGYRTYALYERKDMPHDYSTVVSAADFQCQRIQ